MTKVKKGNKIRVQCGLCPRHFAFTGSTTTLGRHLQTHKVCEKKQMQQSMFAPQGKMNKNLSYANGVCYNIAKVKTMEKEVNKELTYFFAEAKLPLRKIKHPRLLSALRVAFPHYSGMCANTLRAKILEEHKVQFTVLKDYLQGLGNTRISFTCDAWSSRVARGYMGITAHWVDNEWNLYRTILSFVRFPTPHTGETVSDIVLSELERWGLQERVMSFTTDNGPDVVRGMPLLREKIVSKCSNVLANPDEDFHIRCICHIINLAAKEAIDSGASLLVKCRNLVKYFSYSVKRKESWEASCLTLLSRVQGKLDENEYARSVHIENKDGKEYRIRIKRKENGDFNANEIKKLFVMPSIDVVTRWNSTHKLVQNLLKRKEVIQLAGEQFMVFGFADFQEHMLSEKEWEVMKMLNRLLETCATATTVSSGQDYPAASVRSLLYTTIWKGCRYSLPSFPIAH